MRACLGVCSSSPAAAAAGEEPAVVTGAGAGTLAAAASAASAVEPLEAQPLEAPASGGMPAPGLEDCCSSTATAPAERVAPTAAAGAAAAAAGAAAEAAAASLPATAATEPGAAGPLEGVEPGSASGRSVCILPEPTSAEPAHRGAAAQEEAKSPSTPDTRYTLTLVPRVTGT